jgi:hypothetical protein
MVLWCMEGGREEFVGGGVGGGCESKKDTLIEGNAKSLRLKSNLERTLRFICLVPPSLYLLPQGGQTFCRI